MNEPADQSYGDRVAAVKDPFQLSGKKTLAMSGSLTPRPSRNMIRPDAFGHFR
jgi:hypothetical protein